MQRLKEIVQKMLSSPSAQYFTSVPSVSDFPDYCEKVSHIDLTMVLDGVNRGAYRANTQRFETDMRRIWDNAKSYFPQTHARYQLAAANSTHFEQLLAHAHVEKDPLKAMEDRVGTLEAQLKEVTSRLARNERRRNKPPTDGELQKLSVAIQGLPEEFRRGLMEVAPNQFVSNGDSTCQVDLAGLSRGEYSEIRRYIRSCSGDRPKKPKKLRKTGEDSQGNDGVKLQEQFEKSVRKGQAEIIMARATTQDEDSSSSSSSSDESDGEKRDNGGEVRES